MASLPMDDGMNRQEITVLRYKSTPQLFLCFRDRKEMQV